MSKLRYYDDLNIGERLKSTSHVVDVDHMLGFARQYDPQYFHTDPVAAEDSIFGETIASGIYTMALWRYLDHQIAADIAWICGIAWDDVRFPVAVRPGDELVAQAQIESRGFRLASLTEALCRCSTTSSIRSSKSYFRPSAPT